MVITISPVSLAEELWRFGEDDLARRALALSPSAAADIGERAGELGISGVDKIIWPSGPGTSARLYLLAAIEHLDGALRPCVRDRRRPVAALPAELAVTESAARSSYDLVNAEVQRRLHSSGAPAASSARVPRLSVRRRH